MPFETGLPPTPLDARSPIEQILEWSAVMPSRKSLAWIIVIWFTVIALDAITDRLVSLNALYMLPLCLTTWCYGRVPGLIAGLGAVGLNLTINGFGDGLSAMATNVPAPIALWNGMMRVAAVAFLILLVSAFRRTFDRERLYARIDPLTGLGNRRAFADESRKLALAAARDNRILLCGFIDLDNFKTINDTYGHAVGDRILQTAANALNGAVRPYDATARIGGDELAFCMLVRDAASAERKAAVIFQSLAVALQSDQIASTCSLGATAGLDLEVSLEQADRAMYAAKSEGKNSLRFVL